MERKYWLGALAGLVLVTAISFVGGKREVESMSLPTTTASVVSENRQAEEKHLQATEEWMEAGREVAEQTKDPQALTVIAFLQRFAGYGMPLTDKAKTLVLPPDGKVLVLFVPLLAGDEVQGKHWRELAETKNVGAFFMPEERFIIVRTQGLSKTWKGLLLLHEGEHARAYLTERYDWRNPKVFSERERDAHEFENRLMSKLGGETYAKLLDDEVEHQRVSAQAAGLPAGTTYTGVKGYDPRLDQVFGEAQSQSERNMRQTHFMIHAILAWIDRDAKVDKQESKMLFMRDIFKREGVLPR